MSCGVKKMVKRQYLCEVFILLHGIKNMPECDGRRCCVGEISFCSLVLRFLRSTATLCNWEAPEFFWYGTEVLVLLPRCTFTASVYSIGS